MHGYRVADRIARLEKREGVRLVRALLHAEAQLRGLPSTLVRMTLDVDVPDGGIDGHTDFPRDPSSPVPAGPRIWQVKTGSGRPSARTELHGASKGAAREAVRAGAGYVLVWSHDPPGNARALEEGFRNAARELRDSCAVDFVYVGELERWCHRHPAVLPLLGVELNGALHAATLLANAADEVAFVADPARREALRELTAHLTGMTPQALRVHGAPTVGKTRLVAEALQGAGVADRALVAASPQRVPAGLLADLAIAPDSSLVLVVDDCDADNARDLENYITTSGGRLRLVTVGTDPGRGTTRETRDLEVRPLQFGWGEQLAERAGIAPLQRARSVALLTGGYPQLTVALARALLDGPPGGPLARAVQAGDADQVFARLVPADADAADALAMLACFPGLAIAGDAAADAAAVCAAFGVDEATFRAAVRAERGRLVTVHDDWCRLAPDAVAVHLLVHALETRPGWVHAGVARLPAERATSIVAQLAAVGYHPEGERVAAGVLDRLDRASVVDVSCGEALDRLLDHVTLLRHAAAVAPVAAARHLAAVVDRLSPDALATAYRGAWLPYPGALVDYLVDACRELLWSPEAFDDALACVFALAVTAHRAHGGGGPAYAALARVLQQEDAGVTVDYARRLQVVRALRDRHGPDGARVLVAALHAAFDALARPGGGAGFEILQRPSWRPGSEDDRRATVGEAWALLFGTAARYPQARDAAASLARQSLLRLLATGPADRVVAALEGDVPFDADQRAHLLAGVMVAADLGAEGGLLPGDLLDRLVALRDRWLDEHLERLVALVLRTGTLPMSAAHGDVRVSADAYTAASESLRREVGRAVAERGAVDAVLRHANDAEWDALYLVARAYGASDHPRRGYEPIRDHRPAREELVAGYLAGRDDAGDGAWVDERVGEWLRAPGMRPLAAFGPKVVAELAASELRVDLACRAVEAGFAPADALWWVFAADGHLALPAPAFLRLAGLVALLPGAEQPLARRAGDWLRRNGDDEGVAVLAAPGLGSSP